MFRDDGIVGLGQPCELVLVVPWLSLAGADCGGVGARVGSRTGLQVPAWWPLPLGEGGGGRKLAKETGVLGRGLRERLMVLLGGLVGGSLVVS